MKSDIVIYYLYYSHLCIKDVTELSRTHIYFHHLPPILPSRLFQVDDQII